MKHRNSAFTLLELLIVVAILAVLVALAMPFYQDYLTRAKIAAAKADLATFQKAFATHDQMEDLPIHVDDDAFIKVIGKYLQDFRTITTQKLPRDPWGREYQIDIGAGAIYSMGPNGLAESTAPSRFAGGDDILVTWKPQFFIVDAKVVEDGKSVEITFSRKIAGPTETDPAADEGEITAVGGTVAVPTAPTGTSISKVADTKLLVGFAEKVYAGDLTIADDANIFALDGKKLDDGDKNPDNTEAHIFEILLPAAPES